MFAYLRKYICLTVIFNWTGSDLDELVFKECDWMEMYPGAKEAIPRNAPEHDGCLVTMTEFVDADHAGCHLTHCFHSGVLLFVNRAPFMWFSKHQATVKSSSFGFKSIAIQQGIELVEANCYKSYKCWVSLSMVLLGSTVTPVDSQEEA